jgi:hypothetical protein
MFCVHRPLSADTASRKGPETEATIKPQRLSVWTIAARSLRSSCLHVTNRKGALRLRYRIVTPVTFRAESDFSRFRIVRRQRWPNGTSPPRSAQPRVHVTATWHRRWTDSDNPCAYIRITRRIIPTEWRAIPSAATKGLSRGAAGQGRHHRLDGFREGCPRRAPRDRATADGIARRSPTARDRRRSCPNSPAHSRITPHARTIGPSHCVPCPARPCKQLLDTAAQFPVPNACPNDPGLRT